MAAHSAAPHQERCYPTHPVVSAAVAMYIRLIAAPLSTLACPSDLADASVLFALLSGYWPGLDKKRKALRLDCRDEQDKRENAEMVVRIMAVSDRAVKDT
jgi:hypothetical protein